MVRKAVIPAAGRGSRMQRLTKGGPKELLPLGGKPMIQWAVEMHVRSGIRRIAVVVSPRKADLRAFLCGERVPGLSVPAPDRTFLELLEQVEIRFYEQREPRGVADAVRLTREFVGDDPFCVVMPDTYLHAEPPFLAQLIRSHRRRPVNMIGFVRLPRSRAAQFGNVGLLRVDPVDPPLYRILELSKKGRGSVRFSEARRAKGFAGGIYDARYFEHIPSVPDARGELDDVPVHEALIRERSLFGVELEGIPFDLGNPEGYRAAVAFLEAASRSPATGS